MKNTTQDTQRRGSAMATVLVIIGVLSMALATMASVMWQRTKITLDQGQYERAIAIAEAGVCAAYRQIVFDLSATNTPENLSTNFGGGNYLVTTESPVSNILVISGTGFFGTETATVALNLEIDPNADVADIFETNAGDAPCEVAADGRVSLLGDSAIDLGTNGQAHSNTELDAGGSTLLIASKITSAGEVAVNDKVLETGVEIESFTDPVDMPDFYAGPFERVAISNNMVFTEKEFARLSATDLLNVPGGVILVEGDCSIPQDMRINAAVLATGNISVHGTIGYPVGDYTNYPAAVSLNGDIKVNAQAEILSDGWVYSVQGNIILNGGALGGGAVMAGGEISINGSYSLTVENLSGPEYPGGGATVGDTGMLKPSLFLLAWSR